MQYLKNAYIQKIGRAMAKERNTFIVISLIVLVCFVAIDRHHFKPAAQYWNFRVSFEIHNAKTTALSGLRKGPYKNVYVWQQNIEWFQKKFGKNTDRKKVIQTLTLLKPSSDRVLRDLFISFGAICLLIFLSYMVKSFPAEQVQQVKRKEKPQPASKPEPKPEPTTAQEPQLKLEAAAALWQGAEKPKEQRIKEYLTRYGAEEAPKIVERATAGNKDDIAKLSEFGFNLPAPQLTAPPREKLIEQRRKEFEARYGKEECFAIAKRTASGSQEDKAKMDEFGLKPIRKPPSSPTPEYKKGFKKKKPTV